ncbi:NAD-dependent succinate-semialdehyde dehydrogenase [Neptunomonas phycophila]|uniref:NAD-dependent succinate-semialdehyde dehydrogenase n=1 Tax=Neptunomonas phycophila TaxID=1572645 RepID=A0AAW7XNI1_9GAMM|nr:NAD-dependent succinate-semialdehyde dehydrogenase [Neptunomonas phycophila]MDO6454893.1 NAD-dependent succinate-semialdehyde dehydrogenase [Neptunomonas phycophila]MDO6468184.1 NAD-dependent succinate-semialdehyde dehydrogenase [Neptunomonas phycophila]QLE96674.1 NAD-dependent succinate-semialdehyde dehydrogenase [Neptunomonas phycophila]
MKLNLQDAGLLKTQAYINGEWVDGADKQTFSVNDPATGDLIANVASLGAQETRAAIEAADAAMKSWKAQSPNTRSEILERWHQLILAHQEDLAIIMTAEQGKPLFESRGEVLYGAAYIKWFAEEGKRVYGDVIPTPQTDRRGIVIKQPVGVVAAITPWNFPNAMITRKAAPALAVGCAIVLKPAAETPLSALALAELANRAGVPAGLFNVVTTSSSREVGGELTSNPIVKKLTFTGSTPVGKVLVKQCADTMKRTSMELGGNAPVIIFDDADIDLAIKGALISKYRNSGQTCICTNRILVQAGIYDAFVEKFAKAVSEFSVGNGFDEASTHGPLINEKAVDDVHAKVESAIAAGAKAVIGGARDPQGACFYPATILTNVTPDMAVFREEIFGPVAPVFSFETEEEAIAMANDTEFGLAAYVYTENMSRIWRVSEGIEYGMVGVNETAISSEVIPFGGVKESGQGREGSKYGLDDYLETKYICMGGLQR